MKRKIILPVIIGLAIIALSASTVINSTGQYAWTGSPVDGGLTNGTCAACHSGGSTTPTLTVSASPAFGSGNTYVSGQTYTISVNVSGNYTKYGFNCEILNTQSTATTSISTTLGTMGPAVSSNCQIYPFTTTKPYPITASHNAPSGSGNAATFSFKWTAPMSGTGYLYCVGMGVNMSGDESGDKVTAVTQMTLTPVNVGISSHSSNETGLNVFPNPATDNLRIAYTLSERSNVTVKLMSLNGELVSDLVNEIQDRGVQSIDTHLPVGLAKGMYMVKVTINGKQTLQKLMIL